MLVYNFIESVHIIKTYRTMKTLRLLAVLLLVTSTSFAQTWSNDKNHSKLGFEVTHLLVSTVTGIFKNFDVKVTSSKDDLSDAVFNVTADVASIDTDVEKRDNDLKSENYFNAAKYPTLTFKSTSFKKVEGNKYKLAGDLTIKGVTKPVTLDVVMNGPVVHPYSKKQMVGLKITGDIKRTDFGVGPDNGAMISDEIKIVANGELAKD
jgi:polyisoprenoid-binding protein YceI